MKEQATKTFILLLGVLLFAIPPNGWKTMFTISTVYTTPWFTGEQPMTGTV